MTKTITANGHCLCGAVQIKAKTLSTNVGACHCRMCRNWGGGPLLAVQCQTAVEFSGDEDAIATYSSSDWGERGFCANCGTHLFYRLKQSGQYIMPVGLFDIDADLKFDHQVFIDEKPNYYGFANETKNMTGAEVFAAFSGE